MPQCNVIYDKNNPVAKLIDIGHFSQRFKSPQGL